jgi:rubrerythrin
MSNSDADADSATVETGMVVYDEDGTELGVVAESRTDEFTVSIGENVEDLRQDIHSADEDLEGGQDVEELEPSGAGDPSQEEHAPGQEFGEGYIMWRCENCGEMGKLDEGLPTECPNCGSESVIKWRED